MVLHSCNPSGQRLRQEDCEFKASLGCIERPYRKREQEKERGDYHYQ
jgi:hypothetical protein